MSLLSFFFFRVIETAIKLPPLSVRLSGLVWCGVTITLARSFRDEILVVDCGVLSSFRSSRTFIAPLQLVELQCDFIATWATVQDAASLTDSLERDAGQPR